MYQKIKSDESPFVRAAFNAGALLFDFKNLILLNHIERLGFLAISRFIDEESFAKFIIDALEEKSLSDVEAAELVIEVVRNPHQKENVSREAFDGLDWYTLRKNFEAMWNLTTCTPKRVHYVIAWEYPLQTSEDTIPEEIFAKMSEITLEALVWRKHEPLLRHIEENPNQFSEKVIKSAQEASEVNEIYGKEDAESYSEIYELRQELASFQKEISERIDDLSQQLRDISSRKRNFWG